MSYLSAYFLPRDPLLFQKIPCHLVALVKDSAILTSYSSLGLFYCVYPLLTRDQFICIITHLIILYLVLKLSNKVIFETGKTLCRIYIDLSNSSSMLAHIPQILHHMHWTSFPLGSKYNINNLQPLTILKSCRGPNISYVLVIFVKVLLPYC